MQAVSTNAGDAAIDENMVQDARVSAFMQRISASTTMHSKEEESEEVDEEEEAQSSGAHVDVDVFAHEAEIEAERANSHAHELSEFLHTEASLLQQEEDLWPQASVNIRSGTGSPGPLMRQLFGQQHSCSSQNPQPAAETEDSAGSGAHASTQGLSKLKERRHAVGRRKHGQLPARISSDTLPSRTGSDASHNASARTLSQPDLHTEAAGMMSEEYAAALQELQREAERARAAKDRLQREREEAERARERADHERARLESERQELHRWHEQEEAKLKRERKELERRGRELLQAPTKTQRSEVEHLKERCKQLEQELEQKDAQHKQAEARLRHHATNLSNRLDEVFQEKDHSEQLRLEALQQLENVKWPDGNAHTAGGIQFTCQRCGEASQGRQKLQQSSPKHKKSSTANDQRHSEDHGAAQDPISVNTQQHDHQTSHPNVSDFPAKPELPPHPSQALGVSAALGTAPPKGAILKKTTNNRGRSECNGVQKEEIVLPDYAIRLVRFSNGTMKQMEQTVKPYGKRTSATIVFFYNGDVKRVRENGVVEYYYADAQTWHTSRASIAEDVYHFANGQIEVHRPDGSRDVLFPDGDTRSLVSSE